MDFCRADPAEVSGRRTGLFKDIKNDVIAMIGEFVGTVLFLLFALGAAQTVSQVAAPGSTEADSVTDVTGNLTLQLLGWWYISAAFGLSLFAFASVFYRFTGSIFNPSVGFALCLSGVIGPVRFVLTAFSQMLGGIVASAILHALTPGGLGVQARLSDGTNRARGLFIEMFATAALTLSVLMLAAEKHNLTPMAPLGFGFTLFVVMLWSIGFTGGAVNTARAFGPDVVSGEFASYHWIYWLGPTLGAVLATAFYILLKYIGYWRVNPNQDSTDVRDSALPDLHESTSRNINNADVGGGTTSATSNQNNSRISDSTLDGGRGFRGGEKTYPTVVHNGQGGTGYSTAAAENGGPRARLSGTSPV